VLLPGDSWSLSIGVESARLSIRVSTEQLICYETFLMWIGDY
jgi:hypothetical protein